MGGGLLGLGLVLALAVATAGDAITASDEPVNRWWFDLAKSSQGLADYAATFQVLGSGNVTAPVAVVFGLLLAGFRRWHWLAFFALSAAGGVAISELLKHAVGRPRPVWPDPFFIEEGFSFPSGHTLSGVTSWVAMGIVVMFVLTRPWGTILGWLLVVIGVGMGPSRWLYGVHWITDVLGVAPGVRLVAAGGRSLRSVVGSATGCRRGLMRGSGRGDLHRPAQVRGFPGAGWPGRVLVVHRLRAAPAQRCRGRQCGARTRIPGSRGRLRG